MNSEGMIELLKQALLFYGDKSNYNTQNGSVVANIANDDYGSQARFVLQQLADQQKAEDEMNIDWTNFKEPDTNLEDITQIIKDNLNK
jgi:hypothetical protein